MEKEETDLNRLHCINIPLPLLSVSTVSLQCFSSVNNEIDFRIISVLCFLGTSSHDFCRIKTQGLSATYLELRMNKIVIPGVYWSCKLIWHSLWWVIKASYFAVVHAFRGIVCHNSYLHSVRNLMKSTNLPFLNNSKLFPLHLEAWVKTAPDSFTHSNESQIFWYSLQLIFSDTLQIYNQGCLSLIFSQYLTLFQVHSFFQFAKHIQCSANQ